MTKREPARPGPLRELILGNKASILQQIKDRLERLPETSYQKFITRTQDGHCRLIVWVELFIGALDGQQHAFNDYQEHSGYFRSAQGLEFEFVWQFYGIIRDVLKTMINRDLAEGRMLSPVLFEEFIGMDEILFKGFMLNSIAFMRTREEDLNKKINYFRELSDYGYKIDSNFDLEHPLSKREKQVLEYIVKGKTYRHIAESLHISEYTVQTHAKNIYRKLGASSRSEAVAVVIRHKIVGEEG